MTEPDNLVKIPFGVTVTCRRCHKQLPHGATVYNDGKGYLYCEEHNPKRKPGPSEIKRGQRMREQ